MKYPSGSRIEAKRKGVRMPPFVITKIPKIMRKKKWEQGAIFLEKWFNSPSYVKSGQLTESEIKNAYNIGQLKDWLLTKPEGQFAYNKIFEQRLWCRENSQDGYAKTKLIQLLAEQNVLNPSAKSTSFGFKNYKYSDYEINHHALNASSFKTGAFTELNEVVAALGSFVLKFGLHGKITFIDNDRYLIKPESLDIYLWDSFDFVGNSQPLGAWDDKTNTVGRVAYWGSGLTAVTNKDFNDWRTANKKGGDFYITSNILKVPLEGENAKEFFVNKKYNSDETKPSSVFIK